MRRFLQVRQPLRVLVVQRRFRARPFCGAAVLDAGFAMARLVVINAGEEWEQREVSVTK